MGTNNGAMQLVGRDRELGALQSFLAEAGPSAFVITGEPGIGKSALFQAEVDEARRRSFQILTCRPHESEAQLTFSGLGDLMRAVDERRLRALPEPHRNALRAALLGSEIDELATDWRSVSMGVLTTLGELARSDPLLVAIDDVQWLDTPSANTLRYALRRLRSEDLRLLVAMRGTAFDDPLGAVTLFDHDKVTVCEPPALDVEETARLLKDRIGLTLRRPRLLAIHRVTRGNPLFVLEAGRALLEGERDALPRRVSQLMRRRLSGLGEESLEVLLVAAVAARPTVRLVREVVIDATRAERGLTEARAAGVVDIEGGAISFAHPLFGAAIHSFSTKHQREVVHERLATLVREPEERARHLAAFRRRPDEEVAAELEAAGQAAAGRGAPEAAAELFLSARDFTPPNCSQALHRRWLAAADFLATAGDVPAAATELEALLAAPGLSDTVVCDAHLLLGRRCSDPSRSVEQLEAALALTDDRDKQVLIHHDLMRASMVAGHGEVAHDHARAAQALAGSAVDPLVRARGGSAVAEMAMWAGLPDARTRLEGACSSRGADAIEPVYDAPATNLGLHLLYRDELAQARAVFDRQLGLARERGDSYSEGAIHLHLAEVEFKAGRWDLGHVQAHQCWDQSSQRGEEQAPTVGPYVVAMFEAALGNLDRARELATNGVSASVVLGDVIFGIQNAWVLGFAALSEGDYPTALHHLEYLPMGAWATGITDPGVFPFHGDLHEALIGCGRLDEAAAIIEEFEAKARVTGCRRASAAATRNRALLASVKDDDRGALELAGAALSLHRALGQPFEVGRMLLIKGSIERRAKKKAAARTTLQEARGIFEELGARAWIDLTQRESRRIGGRASTPVGLTPTEDQVATLVALGKTNREVAESLFVSIKTVEANLSRIYRKLGVRSRTELAHHLARREPSRQRAD